MRLTRTPLILFERNEDDERGDERQDTTSPLRINPDRRDYLFRNLERRRKRWVRERRARRLGTAFGPHLKKQDS